METTGERTRRAGWWLAPLVLAALVAGVLAVRFEPWHQVAVPADSATPTDVVRAYTEASGHDYGTMRALRVDRNDGLGWLDELLGREAEYRDVVIGAERPWDAAAGQGSNLDEEYAEVTFVPVEMTVVGGASSGFSDGRTPWGYVLVRDDSGPWRIADQGVV